jgi:hypothetical protein
MDRISLAILPAAQLGMAELQTQNPGNLASGLAIPSLWTIPSLFRHRKNQWAQVEKKLKEVGELWMTLEHQSSYTLQHSRCLTMCLAQAWERFLTSNTNNNSPKQQAIPSKPLLQKPCKIYLWYPNGTQNMKVAFVQSFKSKPRRKMKVIEKQRIRS